MCQICRHITLTHTKTTHTPLADFFSPVQCHYIIPCITFPELLRSIYLWNTISVYPILSRYTASSFVTKPVALKNIPIAHASAIRDFMAVAPGDVSWYCESEHRNESVQQVFILYKQPGITFIYIHVCRFNIKFL